jgi:hypothetical protein
MAGFYAEIFSVPLSGSCRGFPEAFRAGRFQRSGPGERARTVIAPRYGSRPVIAEAAIAVERPDG